MPSYSRRFFFINTFLILLCETSVTRWIYLFSCFALNSTLKYHDLVSIMSNQSDVKWNVRISGLVVIALMRIFLWGDFPVWPNISNSYTSIRIKKLSTKSALIHKRIDIFLKLYPSDLFMSILNFMLIRMKMYWRVFSTHWKKTPH